MATFISSSRARDLFDIEKPKRRWGATGAIKLGKKELILNIPNQPRKLREEPYVTFEYLDEAAFGKRDHLTVVSFLEGKCKARERNGIL